VSFEHARGERLIWLDPRALDRLDKQRQPGEGYGEVIPRLAAAGA
jgi:hypothetical protein